MAALRSRAGTGVAVTLTCIAYEAAERPDGAGSGKDDVTEIITGRGKGTDTEGGEEGGATLPRT